MARGDRTQPSNAPESLIDVDDSDSDVSARLNVPKGPVVSQVSGLRSKLVGKFGDAFKRFEGTSTPQGPAPAIASSPQGAARFDLTPIAGSEATDGRSDDEVTDPNSDTATPEMRREMERRQLEEEEQRVAAAQAEYRQRVASESSGQRPVPGPKTGFVPKSVNIQSRVQSLLDDDQRPSQVQRTAEGYGKYSDAATAASRPAPGKALSSAGRKPTAVPKWSTQAQVTEANAASAERTASGEASAVRGAPAPRPTGSKPAAPKKPVHLNSLPTGARPPSPAKRGQPSATERLMAAELPGQPLLDMSAQEKDDYIKDFAKRFPSLGSMELEAAARRGGGAVGR